MIDKTEVKHHIQKHILSVLIHQENARFRDMRPPRVDTNLYSYHLKLLLRSGWVRKTEHGYTLSRGGLAYADRISTSDVTVRLQPRIITMLLIQDGYGRVLIQRRGRQPYINKWTLPHGKVHLEDPSILAAAARESREKLDFAPPPNLRHVGDCYIHVRQDGELFASTLAHVMRYETDDIDECDDLRWVEPLDLMRLELAPAIEQIITRAFFGDDFFFAEFEAEL